ncbi:MAG: hypothetical protein O3B76_07860 [Proteobacteria bacterium]|nr:hypothetical protein [Pseudomonadota bacterium]
MMNDAQATDAPMTSKASSKPGFWPAAAVAGFILGIHGAWWLFGDTVFQHGNLADTDSYARLLRVLRLLETGAWFDNSIPRANWPDGGALHWTRPFDVLMIAIALPMMPVLGTAKAVFWSGVFISPLLHVLVALVMAWAAAPLIGRTGGLLAGALTALQFGVLGYAMVGNADHHLFLGLIAIVAFGFTVRALRDAENSQRSALAAGIVLAFGYWAGMESQILAVLCIGMLGLRWVVEGDETVPETLGASHRLAMGLTGGLFLALLADRGASGFFEVGYDRISIVHLTLGVLILLFWTGVRAAKSVRHWPGRLALAALGASVTLLVMGALYPKVFGNPLMIDVDPELQAIYYKVSEYASLGDVSHVLLYLGAGVIGVPWLAWRLKTMGRGKSVWMWGLLAVMALVYGAFALSWIRWTLYAGLFMSIALADLLVRADAAIDGRFRFPLRIAVKVPLLALLAIGPLGAGAAGVYAEAQEKRASSEIEEKTCPIQAVAAFLNQPPWSDKPRAILSSANFGAELLYRTPHRVTATLHHLNGQGILDGSRILSGEDEDAARTLIGKRQIDLILLCPGTGNDGYFIKTETKKSLYKRLQGGDVPAWVKEVLLPDEAAKNFRLFEVLARP